MSAQEEWQASGCGVQKRVQRAIVPHHWSAQVRLLQTLRAQICCKHSAWLHHALHMYFEFLLSSQSRACMSAAAQAAGELIELSIHKEMQQGEETLTATETEQLACSPGECVGVNFGRSPFIFDLDV